MVSVKILLDSYTEATKIAFFAVDYDGKFGFPKAVSKKIPAPFDFRLWTQLSLREMLNEKHKT